MRFVREKLVWTFKIINLMVLPDSKKVWLIIVVALAVVVLKYSCFVFLFGFLKVINALWVKNTF